MQLVTPMTDKITAGTCCSYPTATTASTIPLCDSVYHSCANVIIQGKQKPADFAATYVYTGPCGPYTQQSGVRCC